LWPRLRTAFVLVLIVLLVGMSLLSVVSVVSAAASETPPGLEQTTADIDIDSLMSIEATFLGTTNNSEHAFDVRIRVEPTTETGPIRNTTIIAVPTSDAFAETGAINTTVTTTDGEQVLTRLERDRIAYRISELDPEESVVIRFRLYPKALVPTGDSLAEVTVKTRLATNEQIVRGQRNISPSVPAQQVGTVPARLLPTPALVGGGAVLGGSTAVAFVWWRGRTRRARLVERLHRLRDAVSTRQATQQVDDLLADFGGGERRLDAGGENNHQSRESTAHGRTSTETHTDSATPETHAKRRGETRENSDESSAVFIDFPE
jgi:hypothetical protein